MDERDIHGIAALHVACLTDSIVTALGIRYARSFYRYMTRSGDEFVLVQRDAAGSIIAAAVVSLSPTTLNRRLLLRTSLLAWFLIRLPRMLGLLRRPATGSSGQARPEWTEVPADMPELILIYASAHARGRGLGRALIQQVERRLREALVSEYQVRTVADASNRALAFYRTNNFQPAGNAVKQGKFFQVFTRKLDPHPIA
jgi:ribosomal protein S18 acetylase RimI-like enzyme